MDAVPPLPPVPGAPRAGHAVDAHAFGEPEAVCEPRERATAIIGMAVAFLLSLCVVFAAIFAIGGGGPGAGSGGGGGYGSGTGSGLGAGNGTGSGDRGNGPGAGDSGTGRLADGPDEDAPPPGDAAGRSVDGGLVAADGPSGAAAASDAIEPPKFGFTPSDERPAPVKPPAAVAPGVPDGKRTRGATGTRGGTGAQLSKVLQQFPNSRVTINLDVTQSMQSSRDAVAQIIPELLSTLQAGTIAVSGFRDIEIGEPNIKILPATSKTTDPKVLRRMADKVLAVMPEGGGDEAETGYQLVIENMRLHRPGTERTPNVEFIITDAPEKQAQRLGELKRLAKQTKTRVFLIRTSTVPPTRIELTAEEEADAPPGKEP